MAIYTTVGGIIAAVLVLYLMYRHTPGWYRPVQLNEQQRQTATGSLNSRLSHFETMADSGPDGNPIVLELSQDDANAYLQALPLIHEQARLPAGLRDPMIVFRKDRLILAARHSRTGERPLSLHLTLRVEPEKVVVSIDSVDVGSLSLPYRMVEDTLSELEHRLGRSAEATRTGDRGGQSRAVLELARLGQAFFAALNGRAMSREFRSLGTGRVVRLEGLELQEGRIRLTFLPRGEPARPAEGMPPWVLEDP